MRHLSEGLLRRLHDDRFAGSNDDRAHLARCDRCTRRMESVAHDARLATRLLAGAGGPSVLLEPALARLRQRVSSDAVDGDTAPAIPHRRGRRRWAAGLIVAPVVAVGLVASANAAGWLSIFSPTQVAPVTLTVGDLTGLPDLSGYGRMQVQDPATQQVSGPDQAAAASHLQILQPSSLPADVPAQVRWEVVDAGSATFTLDAAAAQAAAAKAGRAVPQIPSALVGASMTVNAGPAVLAVYGAGTAETGSQRESPPTLVIAQGVRPTASTNGASLQQVEDFLLAQPGVSPQLAAEIRAIGQPASTLPIPVISGLMTSQTITIDGVQGVVTGDSTGLGTAVIWEKDGIVYVVAGTIAQSEVVDVARSLH
jgi:hypothetical protein